METERQVPTADRPSPRGYGIPEGDEGLLPWEHVAERMEAAKNYWIATTDPAGRPHARPVWGAWLDLRLYFGGGGQTLWARSLRVNPYVSAHLDSSEEAVILEGPVSRLEEHDDPELVERVKDVYEAKYDMRHPAPFWVLEPAVAYAWTEFPRTVTRWRFG